MADDDELPPDFDPIYYLLINPDVAEAGQSAVEHYLRFGRQERRSYSRTSPAATAASGPGPQQSQSHSRLALGHAIVPETETQSLRTPLHADLGRDESFKTVAVLGSAPSAPQIGSLLGDETILVTLNNAWRAASRYDYVVYADDFPAASRPALPERARRGRSSPQYLPAVNAYGGLLYCGASLALATGYWLLRSLPYSQISYFAADMIYTDQQSHFYGRGQPDPIRPDPSLQDHGAKSLRLFYFGLQSGCLFLNASASAETRLVFPRVQSGASLAKNVMKPLIPVLNEQLTVMRDLAVEALALERAADFDWHAPEYQSLIATDEAWQHAAAVDKRWRALEPAAERVAHAVNQALADP